MAEQGPEEEKKISVWQKIEQALRATGLFVIRALLYGPHLLLVRLLVILCQILLPLIATVGIVALTLYFIASVSGPILTWVGSLDVLENAHVVGVITTLGLLPMVFTRAFDAVMRHSKIIWAAWIVKLAGEKFGLFPEWPVTEAGQRTKEMIKRVGNNFITISKSLSWVSVLLIVLFLLAIGASRLLSHQKQSAIVIVYSSEPTSDPPSNGNPCADCITPVLAEKMQFYLVHQERGSLKESTQGIEISGVNASWLGAFKSAVESCSERDGIAKLRIDGFASSESPPLSTQQEKDIYNCEVANRRAKKVIDFLTGKKQDYGALESGCKRNREVYTFKEKELNFEIEYQPWPTFEKMRKSSPVIDELQNVVVSDRALLNRSVRIVIDKIGECQPPLSTPRNASEAS